MVAYFVTGTDTGVGKTRVSAALLQALHQAGHARVVGMKPVAAGVSDTAAGPDNSDVVALAAAAVLVWALSGSSTPIAWAMPSTIG